MFARWIWSPYYFPNITGKWSRAQTPWKDPAGMGSSRKFDISAKASQTREKRNLPTSRKLQAQLDRALELFFFLGGGESDRLVECRETSHLKRAVHSRRISEDRWKMKTLAIQLDHSSILSFAFKVRYFPRPPCTRSDWHWDCSAARNNICMITMSVN